VEASICDGLVARMDIETALVHASLPGDALTKLVSDHLARWKKAEDKEEKAYAQAREQVVKHLGDFCALFERQNEVRRACRARQLTTAGGPHVWVRSAR
jgi:hypothetical protein